MLFYHKNIYFNYLIVRSIKFIINDFQSYCRQQEAIENRILQFANIGNSYSLDQVNLVIKMLSLRGGTGGSILMIKFLYDYLRRFFKIVGP